MTQPPWTPPGPGQQPSGSGYGPPNPAKPGPAKPRNRPQGLPVPEIPQAPTQVPQGAPTPRGSNPYAHRPAVVPPPPSQEPAVLPQIQRPPLDAVSLASVITGALALGPVALGLGIAGLRRTSTKWLRSTRIAGIGIGLGVAGTLAWLGLGLAAALGAFSGPSLDARPGDATSPRTVHASALAVGNCVQTLPPQQVVGEVTQVPCATDHLAQVVAVVNLPDQAYPGQTEALTLGTQACEAAPLPATDSNWLLWPVVPSEAAWSGGVRTGVCLVRSLAGPVTTDLVN